MKVRAFLAVDVDEKLKDRIIEVQEKLKGCRCPDQIR